MKKQLIVLALTAASLSASAQLTTRIETFPVSSVRLGESQFLKNQQADILYLLGLDPDRLAAPYLKGAGLTPKADNYTNWENTGLDGHIGGHYLSALSYMYAATGNKEIGTRLDYFLSEMKRCQDAAGNGYLGGVPNPKKIWGEIAEGNIRANSFGLNDRWVPLYNIHKIYAGLRDAWLIAGRADARRMLVAFADWMLSEVSQLTDEQIQQMLVSEHGGLNEVFADVPEALSNTLEILDKVECEVLILDGTAEMTFGAAKELYDALPNARNKDYILFDDDSTAQCHTQMGGYATGSEIIMDWVEDHI